MVVIICADSHHWYLNLSSWGQRRDIASTTSVNWVFNPWKQPVAAASSPIAIVSSGAWAVVIIDSVIPFTFTWLRAIYSRTKSYDPPNDCYTRLSSGYITRVHTGKTRHCYALSRAGTMVPRYCAILCDIVRYCAILCDIVRYCAKCKFPVDRRSCEQGEYLDVRSNRWQLGVLIGAANCQLRITVVPS